MNTNELYTTEAIEVKDIVKAGKEKVAQVADKASKSKVAQGLNDGMNKSSEYIAKKVVKKPAANAPESVVNKYNEKVAKVKMLVKAGEIAAASAIAIGPIDLILKATVINQIRTSDDPTDKALVQKFNDVKNKIDQKKSKLKEVASKFINNLKSKSISGPEAQRQLGAVDALASTLARDIDNANRGKMVSESVSSESMLSVLENLTNYMTESKIVDETGKSHLPLEIYEAVTRTINRVDYNDERAVAYVEKCVDILINDAFA